MMIQIIGAESLGVRGLSCSVELKNRKIFIDPGIALGLYRYRLLPHPFQIAVGTGIRKRILEELESASDVVISHFDGDHCPLREPNPYQLGLHQATNSLKDCRIWAKGPDKSSPKQQRRRKDLTERIRRDLPDAEGMEDDSLRFSLPVPHGRPSVGEHTVMMTRIEEDGEIFVHASDIQLTDAETIEKILDWKPDIVLVSGPPLYRYSSSSLQTLSEGAWRNALSLSENIDVLIIDHHVLRSGEGIEWLEKLKRKAKGDILCAADFMKREPIFLEAWRKELYEWLPVSGSWHEDYAQKNFDLADYRKGGWDALVAGNKIAPCKWYPCCPLRNYTDDGKLERDWVEKYCLVNNHSCLRYQMEEKGEHHPDNMLPNGQIKRDL
jgi:predicted metallo-beta-lactamase superfamily hydrolase